MRFTLSLLLLSLCSPAHAQLFRRPAPAQRYTPAPVQRYAAPAVFSNDAASFLVALNAWRAQHGRRPLAWDATLAGYAAANVGIHSPGSSGGGMQCWAGVQSYSQALQMWLNSPAHASILLSATTAVGVSPCPSGITCNAR